MPIRPCPNCAELAPRWMETVSEQARLNYYNCQNCGHVWTVRKDGSDTITHLTPLKRMPIPDWTPTPLPDTATITCPKCGDRAVMVMPTTYCQCMYECRGCGAAIDRKPGYCCVFCSYSDKTCPTREVGWCHPPFASQEPSWSTE